MDESVTATQTPNDPLASLEKILGYEFRDRDLLKLALTHPTANPTKCPTKDADRLETLGDTILGSFIMDECYIRNPGYGAGELSNFKSVITSNDTFAVLAVKKGFHLHLNHNLKTSNVLALTDFVNCQTQNGHLYPHETALTLMQSQVPGESIAIEIDYPKVYADLFEAVAGAVYVDCKMNSGVFRKVYLVIMKETIDNFSKKVPKCPISQVYERSKTIIFRNEKPLADGRICVSIHIGTQSFKGTGPSLKSAKTAAARFALANYPKIEFNKSRKRTLSEVLPSTSGLDVGRKRSKSGC